MIICELCIHKNEFCTECECKVDCLDVEDKNFVCPVECIEAHKRLLPNWFTLNPK
jgi:hypothetical protein